MINARRAALQQLSEVKSKGNDLASSLESSLAVLGEDNEKSAHEQLINKYEKLIVAEVSNIF